MTNGEPRGSCDDIGIVTRVDALDNTALSMTIEHRPPSK